MKDHMEKDSGKGMQTGGVGQLGRIQGCGTRQCWLENKSCSLVCLLAWRELNNYVHLGKNKRGRRKRRTETLTIKLGARLVTFKGLASVDSVLVFM